MIESRTRGNDGDRTGLVNVGRWSGTKINLSMYAGKKRRNYIIVYYSDVSLYIYILCQMENKQFYTWNV